MRVRDRLPMPFQQPTKHGARQSLVGFGNTVSHGTVAPPQKQNTLYSLLKDTREKWERIKRYVRKPETPFEQTVLGRYLFAKMALLAVPSSGDMDRTKVLDPLREGKLDPNIPLGKLMEAHGCDETPQFEHLNRFSLIFESNLTTDDPYTLTDYAAKSGKYELFKDILVLGGKPTSNAFQLAFREMVRLEQERGYLMKQAFAPYIRILKTILEQLPDALHVPLAPCDPDPKHPERTAYFSEYLFSPLAYAILAGAFQAAAVLKSFGIKATLDMPAGMGAVDHNRGNMLTYRNILQIREEALLQKKKSKLAELEARQKALEKDHEIALKEFSRVKQMF